MPTPLPTLVVVLLTIGANNRYADLNSARAAEASLTRAHHVPHLRS